MKLRELERDITFSHMLNIFLPALYPKTCEADDRIIAAVNELSKARNTFMHSGKCEHTRSTVRRFYENTEKFLRRMETSRQIEPSAL